MNNSFKKAISVISAVVLSASCFVNLAYADSDVKIKDPKFNDAGKLSGFAVEGNFSGKKGRGIAAIYASDGTTFKRAGFTEDKTQAGDLTLTTPLEYSDGETYKLFFWEVDSNNALTSKPITGAYNPAASTNPTGAPTNKPVDSEYTVTVASGIKNGTVSVSPTKAKAGQEVTVTTTPEDSYVLDKITVTDADGNKAADVAEGKFTMPAKAVTVTATFKLKSNTITLEKGENGTATVDKQTATKGEVVTITATPDGGYDIDNISVTDAKGNVKVTRGENNKATFTMTATDVKVKVTFKKEGTASTYEISVAETVNGTVTVAPTAAIAGAKITITAAPKPGYKTASITVTGEDDMNVTVKDDNTFEMPAKNVTVTVTFEALPFAVTFAQPEHGTVTVKSAEENVATGAQIAVDKEVTVTATAAEGYELDEIVVKGTTDNADVTGTKGADGTYTFTMPAKAVTITATFTAKEYNVTVGTVAHGGVTVSPQKATIGQVVTVTPAAAEGYELDKIVVTAEGDVDVQVKDDNTFEMPAKNVTVTAIFKAQKFAVTVAVATNGTVKVMDGETELDAAALAGVETDKSLKVVAAPANGYGVKTITVAPTTEGSETTVKVAADGTFTMPAEPVTVTGEFEFTGNYTFAVDATYVDFENAETSYIGERPMTGAVNANGNELTSGGTGYDYNTVAIFSFDASDIANKITDAKIVFDAQDKSGSNNNAFRKWGVFENYIDFKEVGDAGITAANLSTLAGIIDNKVILDSSNWDYGTPNGKAPNPAKGTKITLEIPITDLVKADTDGKITMFLAMGNGRATYVDNFKIVATAGAEKAYKVVRPANPVSTDGTLAVDARTAAKDDVITITPTAASGRKLTGVTVKDEDLAPVAEGENAGKYMYTVQENDPDVIPVAATFTRDDAASATLTGPALVQKGQTGAYTAKIYKDTLELAQVEGDIIWSVEGSVDGTTITDGVLTIDAAETATELTVKAAWRKDATGENAAENQGVETFTVKVAATTVYSVSTADTTNGTVKTDVVLAEAGDTVTITTTPATGYRVALTNGIAVSYGENSTVDATPTEANKTYTFTMPAGNATVAVTYEIDTYVLTLDTLSDSNNNSVALTVGENAFTATAEVAFGADVVITPTLDQGYDVKTITVTGDSINYAIGSGITKAANGTYTFKMPGEAVTISATFDQPATISVVYTTDGDATGTLATDVIYNGWVGEDASSTDVTAYSYTADQAVKAKGIEHPGAYINVTYQSGTADVSSYTNLTAGDHPIYITVTNTDTNWYFYEEDFENMETPWSWPNGSTRILEGSTLASDNSNTTKVYNAYLNQSNGSREHTFTLNAGGYAAASGKTTFITDIRVGGDVVANTSKTDPGYFEIQDKDAKKLFSFTWGNKTTAPNLLGINAGIWTYPNAEGVTNIEIPIDTEGNGGEFTGLDSSRPTNTSKWLRLEIELDNSKTEDNVSVKIYPIDKTLTIAGLEAGTPYTYTCTSEAKNIAKIRGVLPRMNGGILLDNIKIVDADGYTAE